MAAELSTTFNPMAPDQVVDPYPLYARARREQPVFFAESLGAWVVTRHADIVAVARDTERFSSAGALESSAVFPDEVMDILRTGYLEFQSLVQSDPPDHTRVRNVFGKALSPQRVAALEPKVRAIADELIDGFVGDGEVELIERFAFPLPGAVIGELLGVPRSDLPRLKSGSNAKQILLAGAAPPALLAACAREFVDLQRYFGGHIEARVDEPREDLLTLLAPIDIGGTAPLTMQEAVSNAIDLLAAGHETTTDMIGHGMTLLIAHPEQLAALRADPSLVPDAVDEILRMEAPVRGMFRRVRVDTTFAGVSLPAEARLFLLYGSANRDEDVYPDPDVFDIRRRPATPHLAFSKGIHFCVGNALARLEGRIAFERLLKRLPGVRLDPRRPVERRAFILLRGYERLPLVWDAAAREA
ncbi:cytochrome P450 [Nannocystis bainbridge]|uniref:Cytochrome P450 n=1 Tax=Nannocystis bainbridge TaxID=2995303 RepID=A0ABT5ECK9_9BACT|nr:cytochrome P450 [Nannocystis bainbridge]MDC0723623.1 cytochrome P450 [Nannocystis bainbridge]